MGPLFLTYHLLPPVSTATTSMMSLISTANNIVHYAIDGEAFSEIWMLFSCYPLFDRRNQLSGRSLLSFRGIVCRCHWTFHRTTSGEEVSEEQYFGLHALHHSVHLCISGRV